MRAALVFLAVLTSAQASAQEWTFWTTVDEFTDETIRVAQVQYQSGEQQFTLFVSCRDDGSANIDVGLTGTNFDPVNGTEVDSRTYYEIPLRFDDDKPTTEYFVMRREAMYIAINPTLLGLGAADIIESILKRSPQIFVKKLVDSHRLRMKFPDRKGPVVLHFPLTGAKAVLLTLVRGCGVPSAGGTKAFVDAEGTPYATFADMLKDETWSARW